MSEPDTILRHAERLLGRGGPLTGRMVLVTAGPTREALDPVRVLTNRSSGLMGFRLAEAAWARGGEVTLVSGPTRLPDPTGVTVVRVESTADLEAAVAERLPRTDVLIMAAAPADFRPRTSEEVKRPRAAGPVELALVPTNDILSTTRALRKAGSVIVGFALETGSAVERARAKLERKDLDLLVVNDALEPGAGFEVETNRVTILSREGGTRVLPLQTKAAVAQAILTMVEGELVGRTATVPADSGGTRRE